MAAADDPSPLLKRILGFGSRRTWRWRHALPPAGEVIRLCHALLSERGEVSGTRVAKELLAAYEALDAAGREAFFDLLSDSFLPDPTQVGAAADAYRTEPSARNLLRLQTATEPLRQELFRRLNLAPEGTAALIRLRRDLLATLRAHPDRAGIDADLVHLFRSWFNGGFLVLRRIDWRTSAVILERLIQYEAVHQIQGWSDLHRRLEADRRCYAFFHPALPDDPLIFIEVALTERMSDNVRPLVDPNAPVLDPAAARCAVFYSITHCQEGLRGVSFGSLLIKQVVEDLERSFPRVKTFATLSPIPDFRRWLAKLTDGEDGDRPSAAVRDFLRSLQPDATVPVPAPAAAHVKEELLRLCAYYLVRARKGRAPFDSVARFHLANGARLERLNWLADLSESGIARSFGVMVNYVYDLGDLERNHEAYARGHTVAASRDVDRLARQSLLAAAAQVRNPPAPNS
jgi:malonyl-CoA decarboxylase